MAYQPNPIKPASTPTVATDPAVVVALHPSSPIPAGTNIIGAANINTASASATTALHTANATTGLVVGANLPITGYGTALLKVTGTFVASLAFKVSQDAGATWDSIAATQVGAGDIFTVATLPGSYRLTITGFDLLRVEVTLTSGSITISGRGSNAVNASKIVKLASGANNIGSVNPDTTVAAVGLAALNATAQVTLNGHGTVIMNVSGTFSATVSFQGLLPDGTWTAIYGYNGLDGGRITGLFSGAAAMRFVASGLRAVRAILTAYTSGTATVSLEASYAQTPSPTPAVVVEGNAYADGTTSIQILGRTAGAGAAAVSKVPIVDASGAWVMGAGTNAIGTVTIANLPTTTGRSDVVLHASAVPSVTAETAYTLSTYLGVTAATGTFYNVTTGKRFRLQALRFQANFATMSATVTFASVVFRLRASTAAGATTASPLVLTARLDLASNMPGTPVEIAIPDGLEWVGPNSLCVTQSSASTAGIVISDVLLSGFEY